MSGEPTDRSPPGRLAVRLAAVTGILCIVLVLADCVLFLAGQSARQTVNERQQAINEGVQANRVDQALVRALAVQASNANDSALRDLLNRNGVTFQLNPPPTATSAPAAPAVDPGKKE